MYDDNASEGPKGSFEMYKAEADTLYKLREYRKAITLYTQLVFTINDGEQAETNCNEWYLECHCIGLNSKTRSSLSQLRAKVQALELSPNEKNCLVARSKCHLRLGDLKNALKDAESSLDEDELYYKGIYQKAEALYYQAEFETALMFYHRGQKLRPELHEFQLGIQKTEEAIENSVGFPDTIHLTTEVDLSLFEQVLNDTKLKKGKPIAPGKPGSQNEKGSSVAPQTSAGSEKTIKRIMGELHGDKRYLEKLYKQTDPSTELGKTVTNLVQEGLSYLEARTDFWRQHKPLYACGLDKVKTKNMPEIMPNTSPSNGYIVRELHKIDQAQCENKYEKALKRCQRCLVTVQPFSITDMPDKALVIANLHSCMGNCYLELGQFDKALDEHNIDLAIGESDNLLDIISRALDNIGRVHARQGEYAKAIAIWEHKLPMSKSTLESTWLCHEIGHCYLELNLYSEAKKYGQQSKEKATEVQHLGWELQASILIAQAEVKLGEFAEAVKTFNNAQCLAEAKDDKLAVTAIKKAIDDMNEYIHSLSSTGENEDHKSDTNTTQDMQQEMNDIVQQTPENVDADTT